LLIWSSLWEYCQFAGFGGVSGKAVGALACDLRKALPSEAAESADSEPGDVELAGVLEADGREEDFPSESSPDKIAGTKIKSKSTARSDPKQLLFRFSTAPHCGQVGADLLTAAPQSLHCFNAGGIMEVAR
jgi:hypothetical protein